MKKAKKKVSKKKVMEKQNSYILVTPAVTPDERQKLNIPSNLNVGVGSRVNRATGTIVLALVDERSIHEAWINPDTAMQLVKGIFTNLLELGCDPIQMANIF